MITPLLFQLLRMGAGTAIAVTSSGMLIGQGATIGKGGILFVGRVIR